MARGAQFADVQFVDPANGLLTPTVFSAWRTSAEMVLPGPGDRQLLTGPSAELAVFREGQQILFTLEVTTPGDVTAVQLKPWWLRANREHRGAGTNRDGIVIAANYLPVDTSVFGALAAGGLADTDRVWAEDTSINHVLEPTAPARQVWNDMVGNIWRIRMPGAAAGTERRIISFFWPASGRGLAFSGTTEPFPLISSAPSVAISFKVGTTVGIADS